MGMLQEFKSFALKGNVVDLAVGVIIGGAFGRIIDSLVQDIIMPVAGKLAGGLHFSNYYIPLNHQGTQLSRRPVRSSPTGTSSASCSTSSSSPS